MPRRTIETAAMEAVTVSPEEQKKRNLRLALILASIAAVFFFGFIGKMVLLAH